MLALGLVLAISTGSYPDEATRKLPIHDAIEAWARARKLYVEQEGTRFSFKATKDHCYNDVELVLSAYTARAMGKDGHDCTDVERFEMVGFKRPDGSLVWVVTFDSVYGSNIAAYSLKDGKLRPEKGISDAFPNTTRLLPAGLQSDSPAMQKALLSLEPHFYLDEKWLRAQLDAKQMAKLCSLAEAPPAECEAPRVVVLKWNKISAAFEADAKATAAALSAAIAEAKAEADAAAKAALASKEEPAEEEGSARRPLRQRPRRQ